MIARTHRAFHTLVALALFGCALCPFIETALHWNGTIFQNGFDTDATLILLLLLLELSFVLGRLLIALLPGVLNRLSLVSFNFDRFALAALNISVVLPEISPPLSLRI
jgi:hypothetical protein